MPRHPKVFELLIKHCCAVFSGLPVSSKATLFELGGVHTLAASVALRDD
jgi:hypothetical protein